MDIQVYPTHPTHMETSMPVTPGEPAVKHAPHDRKSSQLSTSEAEKEVDESGHVESLNGEGIKISSEP